MKISVIIPVHNRAKLVKRAVESVLAQTYPCAEIIVVDDGSTDNLEIKQLSLRIIRQAHKGVAAARNFGIKESKSDWLAFLDSDDYWLPDKLQKQVEFHQANPDLSISQTDEVWIRDGQRINQNKPNLKVGGDIFKVSLDRCMISPSAVMLHRKLLDEVGLFDEKLPVCEDYDLWLRIAAKHLVGLVPEKLVIKTGGHNDQLSKKYWGMDRFRVKSLDKLLQNELLTEDQKQAVIDKLIKKLTILKNGAVKREKPEDVKEYCSMIMTALQSSDSSLYSE